MKLLNFNRSVELTQDLGLVNLVVGGCSFTSNAQATQPVVWPGYLRDRAGFDQVYDCAQGAAGNYHIAMSVVWCLENHALDPAETLVAVMWSGTDRDDFIVDTDHYSTDLARSFYYTESVVTGTAGPLLRPGYQATVDYDHILKNVKTLKSLRSRSIENYLYVCNLARYLTSLGYSFVFLNYADPELPLRSQHFDIKPYLPEVLAQRYRAWFAPVPDIYAWCLKRDQLGDDDFHPTPAGHLAWVDHVLLPYLVQTRSH